MLLFVGFFFLSLQFLEVRSLDSVFCPCRSICADGWSGAGCCSNRVVLLQDYRVVVRIDSWESTSVYPNGHFVRVLGKIGDLEGEVAAILVENSICVAPFSEIQVSLCDHFCLFPGSCFLKRGILLQQNVLVANRFLKAENYS